MQNLEDTFEPEDPEEGIDPETVADDLDYTLKNEFYEDSYEIDPQGSNSLFDH